MRAMNNRVDPQVDSLRIPPHSSEAEQSVLGGLLLDNAAWDKIADFVGPDDFYRFDHRLIFQHIVKLIGASRPADVITVFESLSSSSKAEEVGGISYLNALAQNTPSAANIRRYAEIVRDRGILRRLITVADEISGEAFHPQGKEVKQLLDQAESKIFAIAEDGARGIDAAAAGHDQRGQDCRCWPDHRRRPDARKARSGAQARRRSGSPPYC